MSAALDAISSSVSAMPPATTQFLEQGVSATFASTLAAAQGPGAASNSGSGSQGALGLLSKDAKAVAQEQANVPPVAVPQGKKPVNQAAASANPGPALTFVPPTLAIPASLALANPIGLAIPPGPTASGPDVASGIMTGAISPAADQSGGTTSTQNAGVTNLPGVDTPQYSMSLTRSSSAGQSGSETVVLNSDGSGGGNVFLPPIARAAGAASQPTAAVRSGSTASTFEAAPETSLLEFRLPADQPGAGAGPNQVGNSETQGIATSVIPQPAVTAAAPAQSASGNAAVNGGGDSTDKPGLEAAQPILRSVGAALGAAESAPQSPILLASARPGAGIVNAGPDTLTGDQPDQAYSASSNGTGAAASPDVTAQTGSEIINQQLSPPAALPTSIPSTTAKSAVSFVPSRSAAPVTSVRSGGGSESGGVPVSTVPVKLPAEADASGTSPGGSQTPFSVFFSGPGPGAESAASTLPRMIFPTNGAAVRPNQIAATTPVGNSKTGATPGGVSAGQSNTPAPPEGTNTQPAAPTPRTIEATTASAQITPVQAAATTQAPAPPISSGGNLQLAPTAVNADALPKTDALPVPAPNVAPNGGSQVEAQAAAGPPPVQMAQLINRVGQAEMRVEMNTSAFGSVEVRTIVHANDVGLVIGSEKGDLRTLLANDMPAITNTLQQQNVRLNSVSYMQGFGFSNNFSGGGDSQQRSFVPMRPPQSYAPAETAREESIEGASSSLADYGGGRNSLSILA